MKHVQLLLVIALLLTLVLTVQAKAFPSIFVGVSTEKTVYKQGEPIAMALTVLNREDKAVELTSSSGQTYDFYLDNEAGKRVWQWSADKSFTMAIVQWKLEPGQPLTYVINCCQPLELGKYKLTGIFCVTGQPTSQSIMIEIRQ